jgi:polyisoprenoid-binding protein YceI
MKHMSFFILTAFILVSGLQATAQVNYNVKNFKMSVAGTSTLHDWESEVNKVNANSSLTVEGQSLKAINSLSVTIPAKGIVSTKGRVMDNKTYETLKADKHPNITFTLSSAKLSGLNVNASGRLAIAGVTKNVNLSASGKLDKSGNITFTGSYIILLGDYGMEPPTALMGSIKTGDKVTVKYELTLAPGSDTGNTK